MKPKLIIETCILLLCVTNILDASRQHRKHHGRALTPNANKSGPKSWVQNGTSPKINKRNRIVGGIVVIPNELPYQLLMGENKKFTCGATIINDLWALTAAHCVYGREGKRLVQGGRHNIVNKQEVGTQTRSIQKTIVHPYYDPEETKFSNDIALLKLNASLNFDQYVRPIQMAPEGYQTTGYVMVSGWGATETGGSASQLLQKVVVPIVPLNVCTEMYKVGGVMDLGNNQLCAGFPGVGGRDACQGDSGGPLVVQYGDDASSYLLVGVVSAGYLCGSGNYPGIYTEVAKHRSWIDYTIYNN